MKSTKYQLLQGDFEHLSNEMKLRNKMIAELRDENEHYIKTLKNIKTINSHKMIYRSWAESALKKYNK